ncbi:MAG: hypothetical protein ABC596_05865 [Candidatus Methanosuratincola petrocarbonis]
MEDEREFVTLEEDLLSDGGAEIQSVTLPAGEELDKLAQLAQSADRRLEAMQQVRAASLRATRAHDWVDQGGTPYLQCTGAESIARLWGLRWKISLLRREMRGGQYIWFVGLKIGGGGLGEIEVVGTRRSNDPFFAKRSGEILPIEEVDEAAVQKAAYTNALVNGIMRLLGLRNITWDELREHGIMPEKVARVTRGAIREPTENEKGAQEELRKILLELEGDERKALLRLQELTTFQGRNGNTIPGVTSYSALKGRRLEIALKKAREERKKKLEEST